VNPLVLDCAILVEIFPHHSGAAGPVSNYVLTSFRLNFLVDVEMMKLQNVATSNFDSNRQVITERINEGKECVYLKTDKFESEELKAIVTLKSKDLVSEDEVSDEPCSEMPDDLMRNIHQVLVQAFSEVTVLSDLLDRVQETTKVKSGQIQSSQMPQLISVLKASSSQKQTFKTAEQIETSITLKKAQLNAVAAQLKADAERLRKSVSEQNFDELWQLREQGFVLGKFPSTDGKEPSVGIKIRGGLLSISAIKKTQNKPVLYTQFQLVNSDFEPIYPQTDDMQEDQEDVERSWSRLIEEYETRVYEETLYYRLLNELSYFKVGEQLPVSNGEQRFYVGVKSGEYLVVSLSKKRRCHSIEEDGVKQAKQILSNMQSSIAQISRSIMLRNTRVGFRSDSKNIITEVLPTVVAKLKETLSKK
jgi:hypothetical protein